MDFFEYEDLHMFWENDGITPYFIKSDNEIVGFFITTGTSVFEEGKRFWYK